jgi:hypothetical protein
MNPAPSGAAGLVYSSYLGGSSNDSGAAIAVDGAGNAYLTGVTGTADYPTTTGAFQPGYRDGAYDAFAMKLSPALIRAGTRVFLPAVLRR